MLESESAVYAAYLQEIHPVLTLARPSRLRRRPSSIIGHNPTTYDHCRVMRSEIKLGRQQADRAKNMAQIEEILSKGTVLTTDLIGLSTLTYVEMIG